MNVYTDDKLVDYNGLAFGLKVVMGVLASLTNEQLENLSVKVLIEDIKRGVIDSSVEIRIAYKTSVDIQEWAYPLTVIGKNVHVMTPAIKETAAKIALIRDL